MYFKSLARCFIFEKVFTILIRFCFFFCLHSWILILFVWVLMPSEPVKGLDRDASSWSIHVYHIWATRASCLVLRSFFSSYTLLLRKLVFYASPDVSENIDLPIIICTRNISFSQVIWPIHDYLPQLWTVFFICSTIRLHVGNVNKEGFRSPSKVLKRFHVQIL